MNVSNVAEADEWFSVLQTSKKTQTAIMTLKPGQSSGEKPEAHKNSEQVLLVIEGEVCAEVDGQRKNLKRRDIIVIPPGTPHKFKNNGKRRCVTFNTYSPPEY